MLFPQTFADLEVSKMIRRFLAITDNRKRMALLVLLTFASLC